MNDIHVGGNPTPVLAGQVALVTGAGSAAGIGFGDRRRV
jgi:hypothetical protein